MRPFARLSCVMVIAVILTVPVQADNFRFEPPGSLLPGSGQGSTDPTVFVPKMRFPLLDAPAFANSQVWRWGGGQKGGAQCESSNYAFPWQDNFCETRSRSTGACPLGRGHQGQDIRPRTCRKDMHWAVAAEPGVITDIGSYTVSLLGESGTLFRYLHMNMDKLAVKEGETVQRGQKLGLVSNYFGGTPTTIHLHFEILQNSLRHGFLHVSPYMTLIRAFERLLTGS